MLSDVVCTRSRSACGALLTQVRAHAEGPKTASRLCLNSQGLGGDSPVSVQR